MDLRGKPGDYLSICGLIEDIGISGASVVLQQSIDIQSIFLKYAHGFVWFCLIMIMPKL